MYIGIFNQNALTCTPDHINSFIMLLEIVNNVETTDFYRAGDKLMHSLTYVVIILFALMFLYAAIKYAKR